MAPVLFRLRRGLRSGWPAALGLTVVVAVVGGAVLALVAGSLRTLTAPDRYSEWRGDVYDATIEQSAGSPLTEEIGSLPSVTGVEMASFVFGGLVPSGQPQPADALVFAGSHLAFGTRLTEGRLPDPSRADEFLATPTFLNGTGREVGDRFQLLTITQATSDELGFDVPEPDGPTETATLVGILDGPTELQDPTAVAIFPPSLLDLGDIGIAASPGLVSLRDGATLDDLRAELDTLPNGESIGLEPAEWVPEDVRQAVSTQGQGFAVVALIAAVSALAVVGQMLSRQVRRPEPERLALQAVGMTRAQVVADALGRALVPALLGGLGAGFLAFFASGIFPTGVVRRVEPSPGLLFDPVVHALGAVALVVALTAWVAVALVLSSRRVPAARSPRVIDPIAPRLRPASATAGFRFALSRPSPYPGSPLAVVAGLAVVVAVLVGALTFGLNLDRLVDEPARWGQNYDVGIGSGGEELSEEVIAEVDDDPDVAGITRYGTVIASVGAASLDVTGMEVVRGDVRPQVLEGRLPEDEAEIVLGRAAARELEVGVGEELAITGRGDAARFEVTGLAVIPGVEGGDGMGEGGVVTVEGLRRIDPDAGLGGAAIDLRPGAPADTAVRLSEATGRAIGQLDQPSTVVNLERIRSIPYLVAVTLGVLALLSLVHQLLVSAHRRRRDMAVLRAIGASRRWVSEVVHWQASTFALAVLALATPIGIILGRAVARVFLDRLGAADDISVPLALLAVTLPVLLVLANLVAALPARQARHVHAARVLADE